jgi:hypothetical protein
MAKLLAFWGIKYTYWKIIAVVKSTMLKKSFFFSVVQYKIMFISYHSNMSEKQDSFFFPFFSFIILRILSRIFEFSKIRHLDIKQKRFLYNEWKFERRKWKLISSDDRGKSPRFSEYNQIEKIINNISYFIYYLRV